MINLKELTLFISVQRRQLSCIDSIQLHNEILTHMPRLNKFLFSIHIGVYKRYFQIDLPSTDFIQNSFINQHYENVSSYAAPDDDDDEFISEISRCHIYSLPYQFDTFVRLDNSFQGGFFDKVRYLDMADIHPFEYKFFQRISQDFPILEELSVSSSTPQKYQQHSSEVIRFDHLVSLNLNHVHVDYVRQFLFKTNTHLPRLKILTIEYDLLSMATNNFIDDPTLYNCTQVKYITTENRYVPSQKFHSYFPFS